MGMDGTVQNREVRDIYAATFRILRPTEQTEPGDIAIGEWPREITKATCGYRVNDGYYLREVKQATQTHNES